MTLEALKELYVALSEERKRTSLWRKPHLTLWYFLQVLASFFYDLVGKILSSKVFRFAVVPFLAIYAALMLTAGPHEKLLFEFNETVKFFVWWFGLGVLSSVGLGTGMHSGILFLFPHIMRVVTAGDECGTLNFETRSDMWFSTAENSFVCPEDAGSSPVTFFGTFLKVFWPCLIWGAGTAAGEIPPYAISRAAVLAGRATEEMEELEEEIEQRSKEKKEGSKMGFLANFWDFWFNMKQWMVEFLKNYGFLGVFLMAAWPNVAFDLCGISCGHFLMPFWTFFGAVLLGKAGVKVMGQALFFITIFDQRYVNTLLGIVESYTNNKWGVATKLRGLMAKARMRFHRSSSATADLSGDSNMLADFWNVFMVLFIGYFALSCVNQFAQHHLLQKHLKVLEEKRVKMGLPEDAVDVIRRDLRKCPCKEE